MILTSFVVYWPHKLVNQIFHHSHPSQFIENGLFPVSDEKYTENTASSAMCVDSISTVVLLKKYSLFSQDLWLFDEHRVYNYRPSISNDLERLKARSLKVLTDYILDLVKLF